VRKAYLSARLPFRFSRKSHKYYARYPAYTTNNNAVRRPLRPALASPSYPLLIEGNVAVRLVH